MKARLVNLRLEFKSCRAKFSLEQVVMDSVFFIRFAIAMADKLTTD